MFNRITKKAKAEKILKDKFVYNLQDIASEIDLKPGNRNRDELIEYILKEGNERKLFKRLKLSFEFKTIHAIAIAIILFFLSAIWNKVDFNPFEKDPILECKFENETDTLQVLILPFNNRTDQSNAGEIIAGRLANVAERENLLAKIEYCEQYKDIEGLTKQKVLKIAEELNVDLIIYGDMEKESCSDKKICLNWVSTDKHDYENYNEYTLRDNSSYNDYSNSELRNGSLQEGIDYIVNFFAGQIAYQNSNYDKAFYFFKDKIQDDLKIETCQVNTMLSYLYLHNIEIDSARVYLNKSKIVCEGDLDVYYRRMNYVFHSALENFDSIYNTQPKKLINDYFVQTNDIYGTYNLLSKFVINNHALLRIEFNEELLSWFREQFFSDLSMRRKFFLMYTEYTNFFNLGKIISAEKKLKNALRFSEKNELHQQIFLAKGTLQRFYSETHQILKLEKFMKKWDNKVDFLKNSKVTSKGKPKYSKLIIEDLKIRSLLRDKSLDLELDIILNKNKFEILEYAKYTKAQLYFTEGVRQFVKNKSYKADSIYTMVFNDIKNYKYVTNLYLNLLSEIGLIFLKDISNTRKEATSLSKNTGYVASYPVNIAEYDKTLENLKTITSFCSDNGLKASNISISSLKEMAYISISKNPRISKQYYESALDILNNSEWKNSYLHSVVLFEYFDMIKNNYDSINKKEFALELLKKCEKIRKKLLGAEDPETEQVVEWRKAVVKLVKSKQR